MAAARIKAQDAEIISERHEIVNALELYASSHNNDYPGPSAVGGTNPRFYCIGGTDCMINGMSVSTQLPTGILSIGNINTPKTTVSGLANKGFIYEICYHGSATVCPSEVDSNRSAGIDVNSTIQNAARVLSATAAGGVVEQMVGVWTLEQPTSDYRGLPVDNSGFNTF
jgi:hypothetical protein